ncbi:MAG: Gfo/Idh/MocA family oxidoreductase [Alphaproteobacteria bacterium]|nr:Gfo/Idh/MocA family oxidoreductase [Alphaproteobacteria bacterium]
MKTIKIGVVGVGYLGKLHIENWLKIKQVSLVGFYDPLEDNAKETENKFKIKRFLNLEKLIKAVDAIDIVTPTPTHFEIAKLSVKAAKHIFVEKPFTSTIEESKQLIQFIKESGVLCQVGHIERFNPAYRVLKSFQPQPKFIEVHRLATYNQRGTDVNVILDLMIHDLDLILDLVHAPIRQISANGVAIVSNSIDIANVRLEFHNNCVANLTASRISLKKMRKMRMFQAENYLAVDLLTKECDIINIKPLQANLLMGIQINTPEGEKLITIDKPKIIDDNAMLQELQHFTNSILNKTQPIVSEYEGLKVLELAYDIIKKIG